MRYFLLLPASITFTLLAYLLAPVLPLFAKDGWLPRRLNWFQTPDNSIDGDDGWRNEHLVGWPRYLKRVFWLWRNPAYGFEWTGPLAAKITKDMEVTVLGDPWIKNRDNARAGAYLCQVGPYWNDKSIYPLFGDLCLMLEFGWKLQGYAQGRETEGKAMFVFSIRLTAFYP